MRNTKLFQVLSKLSRTDQSRFKKYLESPYFNASETQVRLFELLQAEAAHLREKPWDKQAIWSALGLPGPYDDVRLRKFFSDQLKHLENFLALRVYEGEKGESKRNLLLLEAVHTKKLEPLNKSSMRATEDQFQKSPLRNAEFYYDNYLFEKRRYDLSNFEIKRTAESNWEEISRNLDYFYIAEKLRIYCNVLHRQNLSARDYQLHLIDEVIQYVERNNLTDIPPIAIYYQVVNLYRFPGDEKPYHELRQLLDKYGMKFPQEEASDLYSLAQNYCVIQLNRGHTKYLGELFSLYQSVLERRIIIREGELSPWDFRNIVVVGLRVGDYAWTHRFIDDYLQYLPEENRENARSFNLAQVYFYEKKYAKVVEMLRFVEYEDITYNLNSKDMLLRVYYDTDEWEPLYSLFESFRTYLNRKKDIPERTKEAYKNLIGFTKKLTRVRQGDAVNIERLRSEIQNTSNVANQKWLLEKLEDF